MILLETLARKTRILAGTALLALSVSPALAEGMDGPVEIIVPFGAGGSLDLTARVLADALAEEWGVRVQVQNLPGGNTVIAVDEMMNAEPDGHRVLLDSASSSSFLGVTVDNLPYEISDRTFVGLATRAPFFFAVSPDSPFKSVADVVEAGTADPSSISWTSLGGTGVTDLALNLFFKETGIDITQTRPVVLRAGGELAAQTAGGHVSIGAGSYGAFSSLVAADKVNLLAVYSPERSDVAPDVPTMAEEGYPTIQVSQWMGISGPAGMDPEAVETWKSALDTILADPEVIASLGEIGIEPAPGSAEDMAATIDAEVTLLESSAE